MAERLLFGLDKIQGSFKMNHAPTKAEVKERLHQFLKYFVSQLEATLLEYHKQLEGETPIKQGKFTKIFTLIGQMVGGSVGAASAGGFIAGEASASVANSNALKKRDGASLEVATLKEERKTYKSCQEWREKIAKIGFDFFKSYEMQMMNINTAKDELKYYGMQDAMHQVAKDCVDRIINYISSNEKGRLNVKAIVKGESKIKTLLNINKRGVQVWKRGYEIKFVDNYCYTTDIIEKIGLFVYKPIIMYKNEFKSKRNDGYYFSNESDVEIFGFRRPLMLEEFENSSKHFPDEHVKECITKHYKYVTHGETLLEESISTLLSDLEDDDMNLSDRMLQEIILNVKDDIKCLFEKIKNVVSQQSETTKKVIQKESKHIQMVVKKEVKELKPVIKSVANVEKNLQMVHEKLDNMVAQKTSSVNKANTGEKPFLFGIKKPTASFTGREATIEKIHKIIMQNCPLPKSRREVNCLVFSGLGGIGKSQLVLFYVQKYRLEFDSIILINSESEASLKSSIFNLASDLGISSEGLMFETVAKHVAKMIANTGRKNLLVFDSADEINPMQILPKEFGNIFGLITSRHKKWYNNEELVAVEALTEEEAVNFVFKSLQDRNLENDGVIEFVSALQCFPLAIRQAVSYIKMKTGIYTKFTFRNYLEELKSNTDNAKKLLSHLPEKCTENDYQLVTLNTWQITFNQIRFVQNENKSYENSDESNKPESIPNVILNICAYLGSDNIPVKIFLNEANRDEKRLTWAIDVLNSYSLISVSGALIKVHKLVQQVTRLNLLDEGTSEKHVIKASKLLYETYDIGDNRSESMLNNRALIPHLLDLKMHVEYLEKHILINMENYFHIYCNLLRCIQDFYFVTREPHKGKQVSENLLMLLEKHYGPHHSEVSISLLCLEFFYTFMGDPQTKKTILERALKIQELHYGADHFEVAITLVKLAKAYGALGDPQTKKTMLERALKIQELHYGADHFEVAITLVKLANAYGALGDPQTKKTMLERALKIEELHYGADHFEVAIPLVRLANAYGDLGDSKTMKAMLERALKIQELHYGADHFEVAGTLVYLATAYGALGDPQTKKTMLERALKIEELHYGADHFEVAIPLVRLANAYGDLGDSKTMKAMLERALKIKELHYGADHFEVAGTLVDLATAYGALGDPQTRKTMLERALKIQELHYGSNNYEVAITIWQLADCYVDLKNYQKGKDLLENVLEIFVNHYGRNHYWTKRVAAKLCIFGKKV